MYYHRYTHVANNISHHKGDQQLVRTLEVQSSSFIMHISSHGGLSIEENLEKIRREDASLTTVSMELFLELGDNFWIDDPVCLTESSSTVQLVRGVLTTCPQLANLQLYSPRATSNDVIPLLAQCLTTTTAALVPRLTSLAITRCVRLESIVDVQLFATTIRSCSNLVDFKLIHPHHCDTVSIDPIVYALADLPFLQSLDITLFHSNSSSSDTNATGSGTTINTGRNNRTMNQPSALSSLSSTSTSRGATMTTTTTTMTYVSPASLHKLLQSSRLTALSLWGCGLHDKHLQVLQRTMNHRLSFLSLRRNPNILDWKPFYHSLLTNFGLKALYNDHADLMSCMHPTLPHHAPETVETAAVCAAEICLALNRLGRGGQGNDNDDDDDDENDWLDMVASVNESSLALYFLLRSRPDAWCERGRRSCRRTGQVVAATTTTNAQSSITLP